MLKIYLFTVGGLFASALAQEPSRTIVEDFATDPAPRGWEVFGEANSLRWNSADQSLSVIWDSSRPNSYFRIPLSTILTRRDDFDVSLDLLLNDFAAGVDSAKPETFQLAFGFQNYADASGATFLRAAPNGAPNLVEFNFMPDTGFGPTIWPAVMSTNGAMNYSGASDFSIFNLPTRETMRVSLAYRGGAETATVTITANGELVGPITSAHLATNDVAFGRKFTQFKVDTFAIASYSDAGQAGAFAGSLLAHGVIDKVIITVPPPPIQNFFGQFSEDLWEASFRSRTNWTYQLQISTDFQAWTNIGVSVAGNNDSLSIADTNAAQSTAFYRIVAQPMD
ncbi:MAG TPA: hypothetical protein VI282_15765 [Verrucomicrobiae bacterium]